MASSSQPMLTDAQAERYSRHLLLNQVGIKGQQKLLHSSVLIVGAGGLGSPVALYLAAAGVGTIGIVDGDRIDLSNLQRQVLFSTEHVGQSKAKIAAERIVQLNPDIVVHTYSEYMTPDNAAEIIQPYDIVINGTDNFSTRYLVNDLCVLLKKPLVDASVVMFEGQAAVYLPGQGYYRCLYPHPPEGADAPTCSTAGVLGALVGQMGTLQAMEALKLLLGIGESLGSRLLFYDALSGRYDMLKRQRNPKCPACGDEADFEMLNYEHNCSVFVQEKTPDSEIHYSMLQEISALELDALLADELVQIIDLRDAYDFENGHIAHSVHIPFEEVLERLDELAKDRKLILVCPFGRRSKFLQIELKSRGYDDVWSLAGGLLDWERHNLQLVEVNE